MVKKFIIYIISLVTVIVIFVAIWFVHPLPKVKGELSIKHLKQVVEVYTDEFGVPHVFAKNEDDLFFTAGYIAARDRLFQLSLVGLALKGELSSVLGPGLLETDIYFRTWKIHEMGKKLVNNMLPINRVVFENFCDGINYRIEKEMNDLPIEFKILNFKPLRWDPTMVAGYARMMAHEMSGSWMPEVVFGAVENFFGRDKLLELIPGGELDHPQIVRSFDSSLKFAYDKILESEYVLRNLFGDFSADIGSNSWVVSGLKTNTGLPFLANDPHLAFTQPPRWYEIHLNGGRFNVSGVCIAGIPIPVIGQNERTAWGFTNTMVDDLDFFIEEIHPNDKSLYKRDNEWLKIKSKKEIFKIKGQKDTTIIIKSTHHGPIISDIHKILKGGNKVLSMSWTGHWVTGEMDAWVALTTMENWNDFTNGVEQFGVPGQNIVYADIDGNIGWRPAVFIPVRKEGFSMLPRPGWDSSYDWKGKVPYNQMPFIYNPKEGYISTANNKIIDDSFPYYISGLWADPSRASRINDRLKEKDKYTMEDMASIQLDYFSKFAETITPKILDYGHIARTTEEVRAIKFLEEWDFIEDADSEAALVFHSIINKIIENIYSDELSILGPKYVEAYLGLKYITKRNLREIIKGKYSSWVDDVSTKGNIETIDEIISKSITSGIKSIIEIYGSNWTNWKWGEAHMLTHKHILGKNPILNYLFNLNVGPFKSGGSDVTPNAGGYSTPKSFLQTSGASMRRIVDLHDLNNTKSILPTGQSGLPRSKHYSDQVEMYNDGLYRNILFTKESIIDDNKFKLQLLNPK